MADVEMTDAPPAAPDTQVKKASGTKAKAGDGAGKKRFEVKKVHRDTQLQVLYAY